MVKKRTQKTIKHKNQKDKSLYKFLFTIFSIVFLISVIGGASFIYVYNTNPSSEAFFFNRTSILNGTGLGLDAPVLFMDFNTPGESPLSAISTYINSTGFLHETYIKDNSLYNNFGTSTGLSAQYWWNGNVAGKPLINGSLQLDGTNDYVTVGGSQAFNHSYNNFTWSFWMYRTEANGDYQGMVTTVANTGDSGFYIGLGAGGDVRYSGDWNGTAYVLSTSTGYYPPMNKWIHVLVTRVGNGTSDLKLYINGTNVNNVTGNFDNSGFNGGASVGLQIGRIYTNYDGYYFGGSIDDLIVFNRALNETEINYTYQEGLAGRSVDMEFRQEDIRAIPVDNRVAYWNFNTNESGNATEIWYGYPNATCSGTGCPTWSNNNDYLSGKYNFDGIDDFIQLSNPINLSTNYSLSFWINQITAARFLAGHSTTNEYLLPSTTAFSLRTTNGTQRTFTTTMTTDKWFNIVITKNDTHFRLYQNGNESSTGAIADYGNFNLQVIGKYLSGSNFNGSVDEFMIFNKTLNSSEISGLYDSGRKKAHFKLDNLNGTTTTSIGEYSLTGTLTNYPTTQPTAPIYNSTGGQDGSGAYEFDGNDDYIQTNLPSGTINDRYTSFYVRFKLNNNASVYGSAKYIFGATSSGMRLYQNTNNYLYMGGGNGYNASYFPIVGWNELFCTPYTSTTYMCYLNGQRFTYAYTIDGSAITSVRIGSVVTGGNYLNGAVDDIRFFNRNVRDGTMSEAEIVNFLNGTINNSRYIGKYTNQGDFKSLVFYNSTSSYWNLTLSTADTTLRSGLVNTDNSINLSNPNLVSYWALDGNFRDATGRNNGTPYYGINNATGISSGAMRFDGVDDRITISDSSSLEPVSSFTLSTWVKKSSTGASVYPMILHKGSYNSGDGYNGYMLRVRNDNTVQFYFVTGTNTEYSLSTTQTITNEQWTHISAVYNGSLQSIYINGVESKNQSASGSLDHTGARQELKIGYSDPLGDATNTFFNGTIDEVLIYNTSLTASQVQQLYKSGLSQHANTNVTLQTRTASGYNVSDANLVFFTSYNNDNSSNVFDELGKYNWTKAGTIADATGGNGTVDKGYYFDGSNDKLTSIDVVNATGWTELTYSFWLRTSSTADDYITSWGNDYRNCRINGLVANKINCFVDGSNAGSATSSKFINDGKWHHIGFTSTSNAQTIYIDGVADGTATETLNTAQNSVFTIGTYSTNWFTGSIDEFRLYNRSLSASEVADLYNLGSYHLNWNNAIFSDEQIVTDGVSSLTSTQGQFMQYKVNLFSNDTEVSSFLINHSIKNQAAQVINFNSLSSNRTFAITQFVGRNGTNFTLGGNRYTFTGANSYYLADYATNHTYDDDGNELNGSQQSVNEILDKARYLGINLIRTWGNMMGGGCESYLSGACWNQSNIGGHHNLFEIGVPGNYSEETFRGLDYTIYEASKRDIRVLPVMINNWNEYGGIRWYIQQSPTTNKTYANVTDNTNDNWWTFHDQFYSDANCKQYYKNYLNYTLNRNNTYSGIQYKNDPAIFAWLLVNEPRAKTKGANATLMKEWTTEMTAYVKSLDSNHLVGMGVEGIGLNETWGDGYNMIDIHQTTGVDFATFAMHPAQWDWFVQRSENATNGAWLTGGVSNNQTINFWTWGTGYTLNNRYASGYVANWIPRYSRHGYKNWVAMNTNISNFLNLPVIAQEVAYPTSQQKATRDKFFQQGIYSFFNEGGDGFMLWNFNHDNYYYSTTVDGRMDDGYSFYYSSDPFLNNKSSSNINVYNFSQTNNTGGTSWVTKMNNYNYTFYYNISLNGLTPANASIYFNITNISGQSTGYYLDQYNSSAVVEGVNSFNKFFSVTDNNLYWFIQVCDNSSICYNSTATYLSLAVQPVITLTSPANNYATNNPYLSLNYTVTDTMSISSCSLYVNGIINQTDNTITKDINQNFYLNVTGSEAVYNWNIQCANNGAGNGYSEIRTFIYDKTAPSATLDSPTNNSLTNSQTFITTLTDGVSIANATIHVFQGISEVATETITLVIGVTNYVWSYVSTLADNVYTWFVQVFDFSNYSYTTSNYTATIDITAPSFSEGSPYNMSLTNTDEITQQINATDANNVSCFYLDSGWEYYSNFTINCSGYFNNATSINLGIYNVTVYVNDSVNNINTSYFTIEVNESDTSYPIFLNYDDSNFTYNYENAIFNVTIENVNGTAGLEFNGTNYTSSNESNIYNVSLSGLSAGVYNYYWWAYGNGTLNLYNISEMQSYTILEDLINPNATLLNPINGTLTINATQNLTVNLSDNVGIKNSSLWINGVLNYTFTFAEDTLTATVGVVVNLIDGIYNWFYLLFDWAGNSYTTQNNTLTIDTTCSRNGMEGYGNSSNPCQITSWTQLNATRNNLSIFYILMNNLNSTSVGYTGIGDSWISIGNSNSYPANVFRGNFNGNNYNISDIILENGNGAGFFGYIVGGNVTNLSLINVNISASNIVGGIVGSFQNGIIENCYVEGTIYSTQGISGGIVGLVNSGGIVRNSRANVSLYGAVTLTQKIGGLVGWNYGLVDSSYAYGNIYSTSGYYVGGLVGLNDGSAIVNNSYSIVTGQINGEDSVGALIGKTNPGSIINNCSSFVNSNAILNATTNVGFIGSDGGITLTNSYMIIKNNFGNITFLELVYGGNGSMLESINLANNSAFINSTKNYLNVSANITLTGIPTTFIHYQIYKDNSQCIDCYNFTSLNAGTVIFNVTGWSNYSIQTDDTLPVINITTLSPNPANFTIDDINLTYTVTDSHLDYYYFNITNSSGSLIFTNNRSTSLIISNTTFPVAGNYQINIWANDTFGNSNTNNLSFAVLAVVDVISPNLEIISPSNNSQYTNNGLNNITVIFNITDSSSKYCYYNITGAINISNTEVNCNPNGQKTFYFNVSLSGNYILNLFANDSSGNSNTTSLYLSIVEPVVSQQAGADSGSSPWSSKMIIVLDSINVSYESTWARNVENLIIVSTYNSSGEKVDVDNVTINPINLNEYIITSGELYRQGTGTYAQTFKLIDKNISAINFNITATQFFQVINKQIDVNIVDKSSFDTFKENVEKTVTNKINRIGVIISNNLTLFFFILGFIIFISFFILFMNKFLKKQQ